MNISLRVFLFKLRSTYTMAAILELRRCFGIQVANHQSLVLCEQCSCQQYEYC